MFCISSRSGRHSAQNSTIVIILSSVSAGCRINAVNLALHALLNLDVLQGYVAIHALDRDLFAH